MGNQTLAFDDFLLTVDSGNRNFVLRQHQLFIQSGCTIAVKEAKSGYLVSYLLHQKNHLQLCISEKRLLIRIYANHLGQYMDLLETLPEGLIQAIQAAPVCKRLVNPDTCNAKCAMGYDFLLRGMRLQK